MRKVLVALVGLVAVLAMAIPSGAVGDGTTPSNGRPVRAGTTVGTCLREASRLFYASVATPQRDVHSRAERIHFNLYYNNHGLAGKYSNSFQSCYEINRGGRSADPFTHHCVLLWRWYDWSSRQFDRCAAFTPVGLPFDYHPNH